MSPKSHRETRFPGPGQTAYLKTGKEGVKAKRQTKFPGGTKLQVISILEPRKPRKPRNIKPDKEESI